MDAAYAAQSDMRSHTGGTMLLCWGTLYYKSTKKLNTRSSTDAEFVVLSEYLPYNLWVVMFVNDQVCLLKKNIIYQDIDIAIELHEKF